MTFWVIGGQVIAIMFDEGCAVLVGNRPWPTARPHYVYRSFQ